MAHPHGPRQLSATRLRLVPDRIDSEIGAPLVLELLDDLARRYGGPDPDEPSPGDLAPPHGIFLVAWLDNDAVGCGGLRRFADGIGEIKRMYTQATARRVGVGRNVLAAVEQHALEIGYERLLLETGTKQPEAIELYRSCGYEPMDAYGQYHDYPDSRCFTKPLR
jgi:GNAT superfamily N-acetyltransferase